MSRSRRRTAGAEAASAAPEPGGGDVTIEEIGGRFLVSAAASTELRELVGAFAPAGDAVVVVVAVPDDRAEALWPRLGEVLTRVRENPRPIVLAMSGAGAGGASPEPAPPAPSSAPVPSARPASEPAPPEAALARRVADAWKLTVVAPSGDVVLAPGGTLFTCAAEGEPEPQWWSFPPDAEPTALGRWWPAPEWRAALTDLPSGPADAPVLTAVPAGVLVQAAGSPHPAPDDLPYAVPAATDRPTVLVGEKVTAADLVTVLSGPVTHAEWRRHPLRLVPAGDGDLLPLGQAVARELGVEVEVLTGLPVDLDDTPPGKGPAGGSLPSGSRSDGSAPGESPSGRRASGGGVSGRSVSSGGAAGRSAPGHDRWHVVLLDAAGRPSWSPFIASVLCRPPGRDGAPPVPRPLDWRPPVEGMRVADAARGVLRLGDTWRVAVTRAGLWAYPADADPERFPERLTAAWPVAADTVRVDVGTADRTLDDRVWPLLDELLAALPPGARGRLHLAVHGATTPAGDRAVHALAARHDARVEPAPAADEEPSPVPAATPSSAAPPVSPPPAPLVNPSSRVPAAGPSASESSAPIAASSSGVPAADPPSSVPVAGSSSVDPASAAVPSVAVPAMGATPVPVVTPGQRSTDEDRAAFRALVGLGWDAHAAPVRRTFSRLPAIAAAERAAAAVDLVAVRLYLTSPPDGPFGPAAARAGGEPLRPYLSCLASGLGRLPTYRGAVLHGVDAPVRTDLTGTVLTEPGPVGGLPATGEGVSAHGWPSTTTVYVIWSDTARRVSALFDTNADATPARAPGRTSGRARRPGVATWCSARAAGSPSSTFDAATRTHRTSYCCANCRRRRTPKRTPRRPGDGSH